MNGQNASPRSGTFVLSIDTELMWGSFNHMSAWEFEAAYGQIRNVIRRLVDLLDRYRAAATWALVGHLMLATCQRGSDGRAHPDLTRPTYEWYPYDWYGLDPCTDLLTDPLWYGPDLLEVIRSGQIRHEIASHSFGHLVFGDPGCSSAAARDDLSAWLLAAQEHRIRAESFVFPRNSIGHLDTLAAAGFRCYRGYRPPANAGLLRRLSLLTGQMLGLGAPTATPVLTGSRLLEIPGSMPLILPEGRSRRWVPVRSRVRSACRGIRQAVRRRDLFHLWLHPMDLAQDSEARFSALEQIVAEADELRRSGVLEILTMAEVTARFFAEPASAS
jgi:peptidoglycan/xylan/chitin deacetylase (PgdA/CDA1 family)